MLNIISRSLVSKHNRGPRKVVANLINGLDELGYPYVVNADLSATQTLWIHDDPKALLAASKLPPEIAIVAGPNIYTLPKEIPSELATDKLIWLHPASWVESFWRKSGRGDISSAVWPVGVDTNKFSPKQTVKKDLILVYNKQRPDADIEAICKALENRQEKYRVIRYGKYRESDYLAYLEQAKAIIWVGRSESQGIGLLEALSANVPALIWDVTNFGQWEGAGHEIFSPEQLAFTEATAVPYFDSSCGLIFKQKNELESSLTIFLNTLPTFSPRQYILNNLSLSKQAQAFMDIYKNHFKQNEGVLRNETLTTNKKWQNATLIFSFMTKTKDAIRQIMS